MLPDDCGSSLQLPRTSAPGNDACGHTGSKRSQLCKERARMTTLASIELLDCNLAAPKGGLGTCSDSPGGCGSDLGIAIRQGAHQKRNDGPVIGESQSDRAQPPELR